MEDEGFGEEEVGVRFDVERGGWRSGGRREREGLEGAREVGGGLAGAFGEEEVVYEALEVFVVEGAGLRELKL